MRDIEVDGVPIVDNEEAVRVGMSKRRSRGRKHNSPDSLSSLVVAELLTKRHFRVADSGVVGQRSIGNKDGAGCKNTERRPEHGPSNQ